MKVVSYIQRCEFLLSPAARRIHQNDVQHPGDSIQAPSCKMRASLGAERGMAGFLWSFSGSCWAQAHILEDSSYRCDHRREDDQLGELESLARQQELTAS